MSDVRRELYRHVKAHPGVHFNALSRDLDIATGQAQYHVDRLLDAGELVSEQLRGRTHYFPSGFDPWERRTVAVLRRETVRSIVVHALDRGEVSAGELAEELDVARSTIAWHVSTLVDADIAEKCYDAQGRTHVRLTRPERTRELLDEVSPSLPDKLVDRFTRMVDTGLRR